LAHISQTSPRTHFAGRALEIRETSSEWPQFTGSPRGPETLQSRPDRRTATNPNLTLSAPPEDGAGKSLGYAGSATPLVQQQSHGSNHGQTPVSRRNSPPSLLDTLSATTRSVPATPLGIPNNATHVLKSPGTPLTSDMQTFNGRIATPSSHQIGDSAVDASDLQASLSRLPPGAYDGSSLTFNSIQPAGREDVSCLLHFVISSLTFFSFSTVSMLYMTLIVGGRTLAIILTGLRQAVLLQTSTLPLPIIVQDQQDYTNTTGVVTVWVYKAVAIRVLLMEK
jgi:hypothetical protein